MIRATQLGLLRGARRVLDDVNLRFSAGEVVALVGENGAGKSTLLSVLGGLLVPDEGAVFINDAPLTGMTPRARAQRVVSLGPDDEGRDGLVVLERIAHGLVPERGPSALLDPPTRERAIAVAHELGVEAFIGKRLHHLSSGERRRVEVARALVLDAPAYLLDEPYARVDRRAAAHVDAAIRERAATGAAVVVSVHDLAQALVVAHRVVGLAGGKIVVDKVASEAFDHRTLTALFGRGGEVLTSSKGTKTVALDPIDPGS